MKSRNLLAVGVLLLAGSGLVAGSRSQTPAPPQQTAQEKEVVKNFNSRVKAYLDQRKRVKQKLPALPKDATPEQIHAYQNSFIEGLKVERAKAKAGDLFDPAIAALIRKLIKEEVKGTERVELKQTVLEADTKGVPLRVNYPYPDAKEFTQIPPTLLLKLPQLPKELKYRFVNLHMLLVDTDNDLIVDYMLKALP